MMTQATAKQKLIWFKYKMFKEYRKLPAVREVLTELIQSINFYVVQN